MDVRATALFETHLTVADLERSTAFYRDVVGLPLALELPERAVTFFWIGTPGQSMLGLWETGSGPLGLRLHIALRASLDDVLGACAALRGAGVTPRSFFGEETAEPSVIGWMPAAAVYFDDPDGHSIEYLAMLPGPGRPDAGIVPWSDWAADAPVTVAPYPGDRAALRSLFEEADDSASALDAYIGLGEVLVADADGAVLGHVQLIGDEIKSLAVAPEQRGRGIGARLVTAAVNAARDAGVTTLRVSTAAADTGNLRFYQRCGFRLRGVDRDAFTPETGYPDPVTIDGIELRDRVWLDRPLM